MNCILSRILLSTMCCAPLAPQEPAPDPAATPGRLYADGRYGDAAAAFRHQAEARPDAAELQYNLAVSLWRAGELLAAEEAAEKYAALPGGGRADLHRGLLGNLRHTEALRTTAAAAGALSGMGLGELVQTLLPEALLRDVPDPGAAAPAEGEAPAGPDALVEQALGQARRARDEFVAAATAPEAGPQLARNLERALRLIAALEELEAELERLQQEQEQPEQEQQDQQDQQESKDQQQKDQQQKDQQQKDGKQDPKEQKQEQKQEQDPQQQPDQPREDGQESQQDPQQGQERPEPAPQPEPPEGAAAPEEQAARADAPGEQAGGLLLTPEQKQRLLEELQRLDKQLQQIRAQARSRRAPVQRDW